MYAYLATIHALFTARPPGVFVGVRRSFRVHMEDMGRPAKNRNVPM